MYLDHDFVQESKLSEDQKKVFTNNGTLFFPKFRWRPTKKGLHQKLNTFFSPNLSGHLRSDALQSQIIVGGDADVDHTQTIGGVTVKLLGGYIRPIPPPPRVSAPLSTVHVKI